MKKKRLVAVSVLLLLVLMLTGCFSLAYLAPWSLSPPSWIMGAWEYEMSGMTQGFTFTYDTVKQKSIGMTQDWREVYKGMYGYLTEKANSSTEYAVDVSGMTHIFKKVDDTTIEYSWISRGTTAAPVFYYKVD